MRTTRALAILFALSLLAARPLLAESFSGKVVDVIDGDTLALMRDGKEVRVILDGIDCPEPGQAYGDAATKRTRSLAEGKQVKVAVKTTDRYKRLVVEVILPDGKSLNQELVKAGMAWWSDKYAPDDKKLKAFHEEAVKEKRGLWADEKPVAPWIYRRNNPARRSERSSAANKPEAAGSNAKP